MPSATLPKRNTKPTLVIGLGVTGFSVVRYLVTSGIDTVVADSRQCPPCLDELRAEFPHVSVILGEIPYGSFDHYRQIVASPGIAVDGVSVIGDIELFARQVNAPVIGITGSNGKSTVTMLVSKMLEAANLNVKTGGNIGIPALDLLSHEAPDYYVLELSSFQLDTTQSLACESSVVLNISEDHMDRYSSLNHYTDSKYRVYQNAKCAVINRDENHHKGVTELGVRVGSFGLDVPENAGEFGIIDRHGEKGFAKGGEWFGAIRNMTMNGDQNVSNALAAMALIDGVGLKITTQMMEAAFQYPGLPHRCEYVMEHGGVTWINDSKGTNVGATSAAIKGLDTEVILIAGGLGKDADFSPLFGVVNRKVKHAILFGRDAGKIEEGIGDATTIHRSEGLEQAVSLANELARYGETVLFSPACSSYDMFNSYEHRGERFKALVLELSCD
ncbi:MAG: UDP-N-acetylmuramoyl-L-alanine--D-glutamate ligase [Gammaproteobacteria bacterium]|nr:UDP-N-acetylmuramoyl-L-alanine--D-glutamate ligase [Gammaproteobacteria bacterium]